MSTSLPDSTSLLGFNKPSSYKLDPLYLPAHLPAYLPIALASSNQFSISYCYTTRLPSHNTKSYT